MRELRAEHVGSLLRPAALLAARKSHAARTLPAAALREAEDRAILDVIALQQRAGITLLSDGELRRAMWFTGFMQAVEGLVRVDGVADGRRALGWHGPTSEVANRDFDVTPLAAVQRLRLDGRFTAVEADFLEAHVPGAYKVTLPSPTVFRHLYRRGITDGAYPSEQALIEDIVAIYEREVDALIAGGARYIQLDSLRYLALIDDGIRQREAAAGTDLDTLLERTIAADNRVLARARRPGVTRALHLCRGNHRSAWGAEGAYDAIAERLFGEIDADRLLLEYDDERSGGFEPLRFLPAGKIAVLGLVSSKLGRLETADELMRRVDEAATVLPLESLALSPQCGFASTELGNLLTEAEEERKLALVVETARQVWG